MNREIKFRGKSSVTNEWIYGFPVRVLGENHIIGFEEVDLDGHHIRFCSDRPIFTMQGTICQFIGLYDKNSKEAYFGDIVRFTPKVLNLIGSDYIETDYDLLAVIDTDEYNHSVLRILNDKGKFKKGDFYHIEGLLKCEIVGNIFDNKELLKE